MAESGRTTEREITTAPQPATSSEIAPSTVIISAV
jgi:hypothetical protein